MPQAAGAATLELLTAAVVNTMASPPGDTTLCREQDPESQTYNNPSPSIVLSLGGKIAEPQKILARLEIPHRGTDNSDRQSKRPVAPVRLVSRIRARTPEG